MDNDWIQNCITAWRLILVLASCGAAVALFLTLRKLPGGMANASRMLIIGHFALLASASWTAATGLLYKTGATPILALSTFGVSMTLVALKRFAMDSKRAALEGKEWHSGGFL